VSPRPNAPSKRRSPSGTRPPGCAIDSLPTHQRTALTLKLGEDLKLAQIGEIMGKSEGAVKLLIHRGMIGVRHRLGVTPQAERV